jgi:malate dehydrogenase (oxaloacetate-decarboxylating)(NADP+)
MAITKQDALTYHEGQRPGKIELGLTKPCRTQRDLSLAYTPGVADPCLEIEKNPADAFRYTAKGNLVAVISNGTAVLGLGDIGALAGKPVMEGKGVLFKRFADVDVFDLEVNSKNPDEVIKFCELLEPTFGGINLEDIKAPECFYIEEELKKKMKIPVFHDDQHGTAIISGAALLNAMEIIGKDLSKIRVVFAGAGAAGIACAEHYIRLGVKRENIILCDTKGVVYKGRKGGMNPYKERFALDTQLRTLQEALVGADVFVGLSGPNTVTPDMIQVMGKDPVVFAMANPIPEISFEDAKAARADVIVATGRSDYPNQVNNVLGFPFIFRGALDVRATAINEEMKLAATHALADLAKEDVPDSVCRAYGVERLKFGRDYLIPKPFDPRVLVWEATAVAKAAMETGVAQVEVDLAQYREQLEKRFGKAHEIARMMILKASAAPKRVVFPEGEHEKILRACHILVEENIAHPILLGRFDTIRQTAQSLGMSLDGIEVIEPAISARVPDFTDELYRLRHRKGLLLSEARQMMLDRDVFGSMMVHLGDADALVSGITHQYPETIRPALQIIGVRDGVKRVAGLYCMVTKQGDLYFLSDTTVNIDPNAEELAEIAMLAAQEARRFDVEPRVAMLSFSNFGSKRHPLAEKMRKAVEIVRDTQPDLMIDGEMQADVAVTPDMITEHYPFSSLKGRANVLIFPNLEAGNIAYKLLMRIGAAEAIGPLLVGMARPVHVLQRGFEVDDIVNVTAIAVVDAQDIGRREHERNTFEALIAGD